ncbi:MAG: hypothetical protein HOI95_16810 [Chromatiales bacterium]|jgi:hypothetical protein|nr:hypothetical protein [Chromatiales bacterium]
MKQATFPFDDDPSNTPDIEFDAELEQQLLGCGLCVIERRDDAPANCAT